MQNEKIHILNSYLRKSLIFSNSSPRIIDNFFLCAYHDALSLRNTMVFSPAITLYCALISRNAAYWFIALAERIFDWCDNKRKIGRIIEGCLSLRACSRSVWDNAVLLRHGISISRVANGLRDDETQKISSLLILWDLTKKYRREIKLQQFKGAILQGAKL